MQTNATRAKAQRNGELTLESVTAYEQKKLARAGIVSRVMSVTPEMATGWLERNRGNRPISKARVLEFERLIKEDKFYGVAQGILFDDEMTLIDGQHRLLAIVKCGATVDMLVVSGLDRVVAFGCIDEPKIRSTPDLLSIAAPDLSNLMRVGSIAAAMIGGLRLGPVRGDKQDRVTFTLKHRAIIQKFCAVIPKTVGCAYIAAFCNAVRTDHSVSSGGLPENIVYDGAMRLRTNVFEGVNDPMNVLSRRINRERTALRQLRTPEKYGLAVAAISALVEGRTLTTVIQTTRDFGQRQ